MKPILRVKSDGKVNMDLIREYAKPFKKMPKKKGKYIFHRFAQDIGHAKEGVISTKAGVVLINTKSQFWKMLRHKNNRANVLMNIRTTLKDPMLITKEGDNTYIFFSSYLKKDGSLMNMVSVCTKEDSGFLILKTNYELKQKNLGRLSRILRGERGEIKYKKEATRNKRNMIKM